MGAGRRALAGTAALTAGVTAGAAALRARSAAMRRDGDRERWLVVTVNRPPEEVLPDGAWPEPLARLEHDLEVRVRPAPGDRGSELSVRRNSPGDSDRNRDGGGLAARLAGRDPRQEIRAALRDAKSLLEAGEVIEPDRPSTTHDTPGGRLLGAVTRRAGREGVL